MEELNNRYDKIQRLNLNYHNNVCDNYGYRDDVTATLFLIVISFALGLIVMGGVYSCERKTPPIVDTCTVCHAKLAAWTRYLKNTDVAAAVITAPRADSTMLAVAKIEGRRVVSVRSADRAKLMAELEAAR